MRKKAVIIIPTYNEKENVQKIVPQIFAVVEKIKNYQVEILVVDDTSPDKTYEAVKKMQQKFPRLHLLLNKEKAGLGGAYAKGMAEAFNKLKADYVFEFDADGSHDPQKLPEFFTKLDEGYDFVIGGRYRHGGSIDPDWPLLRKFYSIVGNFVIMTVLTDFRIGDWTSGYRAISKKVYQSVIDEMGDERFSGYTWQIGFLHKAVRKNFKITEVPIHFKDRQIGESKLGSEYIKNTLYYIFKARRDEILSSRFIKVALVGGVGFLVQMIALAFFRTFISSVSLANLPANEIAIISNFILNNAWSFSDKKLSWQQIPFSFLKFNLGSVGSIIIQFLITTFGENVLGIVPIFTLGNFVFDTGYVYTIIGIFIGLIFNFYIYNKFIWNQKDN
ncbi:MAG: glycosyltransferase [bacterium]|nr:glycosyltransferase [bacterium]